MFGCGYLSYMCRPDFDVRGLPQCLSTLYFETRNLELTDSARPLASKSQGSFHLCFPNTKITDTGHHASPPAFRYKY